MSFPNETPLEDVLKYIKQATQGPNDAGIPIYVDPQGLQEADKTLTSPIRSTWNTFPSAGPSSSCSASSDWFTSSTMASSASRVRSRNGPSSTPR